MLLRDSIGAVAFTAVALQPALAHNGVTLGELPPRPGGALAAVLALAQTLPLAVRRSWPGACLAVVGIAFAIYQCLGYPGSFTSTGLILALYAAGAHERRFRRGLAAAASAAYVGLAIMLAALRSPERPVDYVTFYLVLACCWAAGSLVRARQLTEAERRRRAAADAVAAERARIARELHDVVTHHVTAMVVQAGAAQVLLPSQPERAAGQLGDIGTTGRRALAELRYLLGLLDAGPAVDLALAAGRLRDLVDQARRTGQPVELVEEGEPVPLADAAGLAAYRVVQEALTNALKHAPGRRAMVRVSYDPGGVTIDVTTDGPILADGAFATGRGLAGLRDRVGMCGGELAAGGSPGGGFRVRAWIPAEVTGAERAHA